MGTKEAGGNVQMSPSGNRTNPSHWFTSEIQQMMHGFGDCRKPLQESAALLEEIVHSQMVSLLHQASDIASMRNGRFIGIEDFLFLLRKDKVKLRRLLRYMELKDVKNAALKGMSLDEEETSDSGTEKGQPVKKRRKICYDFISSFDQTGELLALFDDDSVDDVKRERLIRAELQSRGMDSQQYMEFCEARQVNFSRRYKSQRFKDWLMLGVSVDIKPNPMALEVFSYLAYETVAQLIDLALLVRHDTLAHASNPIIRHMPSICVNYHEAYQETVATGAMTAPSQSKGPGLVSPNQSPPSTPSTPVSSASSSTTAGSLSASQSGGSSGSSKPKSKKRKKSGPASSAELAASQAITPAEIREALRRHTHFIGPLAGSVKLNTAFSPKVRLFCA